MADGVHTVLSKDRERVGGMWEEPADHHPPPTDAHLPRSVGDAICTRNTGRPSAALALDAVSEIRATATVQRFRPLQSHHRIIDLSDDAARLSRRFCTITNGQINEYVYVYVYVSE